MLFNAINGNLKIENTSMDYVAFGKGDRPLVMLPGLGDGLKTVKGTALTMAVSYRKYAKHFRVFVFSRKNQLDAGYSTRDMAHDLKFAMQQLGINTASVVGISQGGMIAQYLAIDCPEMVEHLVLGMSIARPNAVFQQVISSWISKAQAGNYRELFADTMEKSQTPDYINKFRIFMPLLSRITKPKNFDRFIIQAEACLTHNAWDELGKIQCPTLVIGGDDDHIVGAHSSQEIAGLIKGSRLVLYPGLGHGAFMEAPDFNQQILRFLTN